MKLKQKKLPAELSPFVDLSCNYWWMWHSRAVDLFTKIDPVLWESVNHNPIKLLNQLSEEKIKTFFASRENCEQLKRVYREYLHDLDAKHWFQREKKEGLLVAYFSAEFGIHESFPNYSGGLGVLAGGHLKSSSNLGIPLVAVGLLYSEGYFSQVITNGKQEAKYNLIDPADLPLVPVTNDEGEALQVEVEVASEVAKIQIWELNVGRTRLFLLDTNLAENSDEIKQITQRLYGGDSETRMKQEIVLGVGGIKALRAMQLSPTRFHANEGHSAFLIFELIYEKIKEGFSLDEALAEVKKDVAFTTHTPIEAGHDRFTPDEMKKYFSEYAKRFDISFDDLMALGRTNREDKLEWFCMTVLALKGASRVNAVSKLHEKVTQTMWSQVESCPIHSITNGVHIGSWLSPEIEELFETHLPDWPSHVTEPSFWKDVEKISNDELQSAKQLAKKRLKAVCPEINENALVIGFARRFATYKRATLLFKNLDRLKAILSKEVQIVFSGKAHPKDEAGQKFIQEILAYSKEKGLEGKILFIEDYDIHIGRELVRGVDVWLNNPEKPMEASGTSGMKVAMNGGLNLSIDDGWWAEGFNGKNGWSISGDLSEEEQLETIYDLLENSVIPMYFERKEEWTAFMKEAIMSILPQFNTDRMLKEYVEKMYL